MYLKYKILALFFGEDWGEVIKFLNTLK